MKLADLRKDERWRLAGVTLALAVIVLFPMLGSYGLWDPQEINVADQARQLIHNGGYIALWHKQLPWSISFRSFRSHLPSLSMAMGMTSKRDLSRLRRTEAAETSETSCSPERPP